MSVPKKKNRKTQSDRIEIEINWIVWTSYIIFFFELLVREVVQLIIDMICPVNVVNRIVLIIK